MDQSNEKASQNCNGRAPSPPNSSDKTETPETLTKDEAYKKYIAEQKQKRSLHGPDANFMFDVDHRSIEGWEECYGVLVYNSTRSEDCPRCNTKLPRFSTKKTFKIHAETRLVTYHYNIRQKKNCSPSFLPLEITWLASTNNIVFA